MLKLGLLVLFHLDLREIITVPTSVVVNYYEHKL